MILIDLGALTNLSVDRCYFNTESAHVKFQLHGFGDASLQAYPTVVYLMQRGCNSQDFNLKSINISHKAWLELLAAVILARLVINCCKEISTNAGRHGLTFLD